MSLWAALLLTVFLACLLRYRKSPSSRLPLPPGPRRLPFIGNVFDMPKRYAGADFRALTDKYGTLRPVYYSHSSIRLSPSLSR